MQARIIQWLIEHFLHVVVVVVAAAAEAAAVIVVAAVVGSNSSYMPYFQQKMYTLREATTEL